MVNKNPLPCLLDPDQFYLREMNLSECELTLLGEVSLAVTQLLQVEDILELALRTFADQLDMDSVMIYLEDPLTGRYELRASRGITPEQEREIERRRAAGHDITQEVISSGEGCLVEDMAADARFHGIWEPLVYRSYVKIPLVSRGKPNGVLGLVTQEGERLTVRDVEFLKVVGQVIGIGLDNTGLLAKAKQRENRAKSLYQMGVKISPSLSIGNVLEIVAYSVREIMEADLSLVCLVEGDPPEMAMEAISGRRTSSLPSFGEFFGDQSLWRELLDGQAVQMHGAAVQQSSLDEESFIRREGVESLLAAPLIRAGVFQGLIVLMHRTAHHYSQDDIRMLDRLAHQVGLSIENVGLYQQLHHMGALEERDRLARELHDKISQTLGYLKVKTCLTQDLLADGEVKKAQEGLQQIRKVSEILYTDVREEIFNLRESADQQKGFFESLQDYLANYHTFYGLQVELVVESECVLEIPEQISCQLMRIIQEALSNVRKHAQASKVLISCSKREDQMLVEVADDGQGFQVEELMDQPQGNYGLQIMRERVEGVGGALSINSQPGSGTRVVIRCPLTDHRWRS
jgi:signal transduction histidine kinase